MVAYADPDHIDQAHLHDVAEEREDGRIVVVKEDGVQDGADAREGEAMKRRIWALAIEPRRNEHVTAAPSATINPGRRRGGRQSGPPASRRAMPTMRATMRM